ncbi:hypothetical protein AZE42_03791, partial [Rhizopogon vesiculosus]
MIRKRPRHDALAL